MVTKHYNKRSKRQIHSTGSKFLWEGQVLTAFLRMSRSGACFILGVGSGGRYFFPMNRGNHRKGFLSSSQKMTRFKRRNIENGQERQMFFEKVVPGEGLDPGGNLLSLNPRKSIFLMATMAIQ